MWISKKELLGGILQRSWTRAQTRKTPGPGVVTVESRNMSASSAKSSKKDNSNHGGGDESSGKLQEGRFNPSIAMFIGPVCVLCGPSWGEVQMMVVVLLVMMVINRRAASANTPPGSPRYQRCYSGISASCSGVGAASPDRGEGMRCCFADGRQLATEAS